MESSRKKREKPRKLYCTFPCSLRTSGATWKVFKRSKISINRPNAMNSDLVHKINDRTALQLRSGVTELLESDETRIRVAQNTMSVPELAKIS